MDVKDGCTVVEMNKEERGLEPTGTEVIFGKQFIRE